MGAFLLFWGCLVNALPADMLTLYSYLHGKQIDKTEQKNQKKRLTSTNDGANICIKVPRWYLRFKEV